MKRSLSKSNKSAWHMRLRIDPKECALFILCTILLCSFVAALCSCKSQKPVVDIQHANTTQNHTQLQRDSIIIRDSIFIHVKGDTVFRDRWRTEYRESNTQQADSSINHNNQITQLPPERYIPVWACLLIAISTFIVLLFIVKIILRIWIHR